MILLPLLLTALWQQARGHCQASPNNISCTDTTMKDLLSELFEPSLRVISSNDRYIVSILNSNFQIVDYFPPLFSQDNITINQLTIRNSSVEQVRDNAFEELDHMGRLDLSLNKLRNISFVTTLPTSLWSLCLSNNNITYLDDVFGKLMSLTELDLSYNKISTVDFSRIPINRLNFRNNCIVTLLYLTNSIRWPKRDLSNSAIIDASKFDLDLLGINSIDLSWNNLTILTNYTFTHSSFRQLNLSHLNIAYIQKEAIISTTIGYLDLTYNNLNNTDNICDNATIYMLDLAFNPMITTIRNYSFRNCLNVFHLNLSHCNIQKIEPKGFTGLNRIKNLDLSYNKLRILESNVFNHLPLEDLSLFGNRIDIIRNSVFNQLDKLRRLNLSYTGLRNLESFSFTNMTNIEVVDLSNNNLKQIPHQLFFKVPNLKEVYLNGNNITTFDFFDNRARLHTLYLSFSGIFQPNKEYNLYIKHLYIIDSHISILKNGSFNGLYKLETLCFNNSYVRMERGALDTLFRLKHLDAQNLFRHDKVIRENTFNDLVSLPSLNLSHLSLEVLEPKAFNGMKRLTILLLNNNNITHLNAGVFFGLESLTTLDLSSNQITSCDENAWVGLRKLMVLKLQDNKLSYFDPQTVFDKVGHWLELFLNNTDNANEHGSLL